MKVICVTMGYGTYREQPVRWRIDKLEGVTTFKKYRLNISYDYNVVKCDIYDTKRAAMNYKRLHIKEITYDQFKKLCKQLELQLSRP